MKAYEFGDEISDDEIFEHLSNSKNDMKKDTKKNWADFDAYFDNLQISRNASFPPAAVQNFNNQSNAGNDDTAVNNMHAFDWDDFDTTNVVTTSSTAALGKLTLKIIHKNDIDGRRK